MSYFGGYTGRDGQYPDDDMVWTLDCKMEYSPTYPLELLANSLLKDSLETYAPLVTMGAMQGSLRLPYRLSINVTKSR